MKHVGLNVWPPHLPELTLLDFYLWGYMKEFVYENESQTQMYCYGTPLILLLSYRTFTEVCRK